MMKQDARAKVYRVVKDLTRSLEFALDAGDEKACFFFPLGDAPIVCSALANTRNVWTFYPPERVGDMARVEVVLGREVRMTEVPSEGGNRETSGVFSPCGLV